MQCSVNHTEPVSCALVPATGILLTRGRAPIRWIPVSRVDVITRRREMPDAAALASPCRICWIASRGRGRTEARMVPFFVQIKCQLGKSYEVANKLADAEIASEIYSTAGDFDLLAKFYVEPGTDIGHFVNEKVQTIPGIQDTRTVLTFKAFSR